MLQEPFYRAAGADIPAWPTDAYLRIQVQEFFDGAIINMGVEKEPLLCRERSKTPHCCASTCVADRWHCQCPCRCLFQPFLHIGLHGRRRANPHVFSCTIRTRNGTMRCGAAAERSVPSSGVPETNARCTPAWSGSPYALWGKLLPIRPAIVDVRIKDGDFLRLSRGQHQPTQYHTVYAQSPAHAQAPSRLIQEHPGDRYGSPYTTAAPQHRRSSCVCLHPWTAVGRDASGLSGGPGGRSYLQQTR